MSPTPHPTLSDPCAPPVQNRRRAVTLGLGTFAASWLGAHPAVVAQIVTSAFTPSAALGGFGAYVETLEALPDALDRAVASGNPACVNVRMAGRPAPVVL